MGNNKTNNTIQAAWIGIGSLSSFMFSIVSAAILSRFLSKSDYGTYKQVMYVYHTLLTVFVLGLPKAYSYFLPKAKLEEGNHIVNKLNYCFFLIGAFFSVFLYISATIIAQILKNPDLSYNIKLFSTVPLFLLPTMGLEGIMASYNKNYINALYVILTRILMLLFVALPVALYKSDCSVAIIGFSISSFLSCIIALYLKKVPFKNVTSIKSDLKYKEVFAFSIPLMIASIWAILIKAADQFFISRYFGQEIFADFSNGSLELPFVHMVLSACGTVLLPIFIRELKANTVNKGEMLSLWMRAASKATYILYPLIIYCWVYAPLIMTFLYGNNYIDSAIYFRIQLFVNFFTVAQYYPIIVAIGKTKYYANVHLFCAILVWLLECLIIWLIPNPYLVCGVSVLCHLVKIFLMISLISKFFNKNIVAIFPLKNMLKVFTCCVICALIIKFAFNTIEDFVPKLIMLMITFAIYAAGIFMLGRFMKIDYIQVIRPIISKLKKK